MNLGAPGLEIVQFSRRSGRYFESSSGSSPAETAQSGVHMGKDIR
jgi:hypothetical protein